MSEFPIEAFTWIIKSKIIFGKLMDKSVFIHDSTGIPIEIKEFWEVSDLIKSDSVQIEAIYDTTKYIMKIYCDPLNRTRLRWNKDFADIIKGKFPESYELYSNDNKPIHETKLIFMKYEKYKYYIVFE